MNFKVIKSCFDGLSGGASNFQSINEVLREISFYRGWNSLDELHDSIRKWSSKARPGDIFCTQATAIIALADQIEREYDVCPSCLGNNLEYDELHVVEDGGIEQRVSCPSCGKRWLDLFHLSERKLMGGNW